MRPAPAAIVFLLSSQFLPVTLDPMAPSHRFVGQPVPEGRLSTNCEWSPVGHRIALFAADGVVVVDPDSLSRPLRLPIGRTTSVAWRADGALLACRTQSIEQNRQGESSIVVVSLGSRESVVVLRGSAVGPMAFDSRGRLHVWSRMAGTDTVLVPSLGPPLAATTRAIGTLLPWSGRGGAMGSRFFDGNGERSKDSSEDASYVIPGRRTVMDSVPDSSWFLVAAEGETAWHTLLVDERGKTLRDFGPRLAGEFSGHSITPDGRRVIGVMANGEEAEGLPQPLAVLDVQTGKVTIVEGATSASFPSWSRDGRFVVYLESGLGTMIGTITPE